MRKTILLTFIALSFTPLLKAQLSQNIVADTGVFVDERDNIAYPWVKIGNQVWMAKNLDYLRRKGNWCYADDSMNCAVYGRLYDWNAAMKACPKGWHLPSIDEWLTLINYLGGESFAGIKMKEAGYNHWNKPNTNATNKSGFTALPGGYRGGDGSYNELGNFSQFWSSTEHGDSFAWYRSIGANFSQAFLYSGLKTEGRSVRCIRDPGK